MSDEYRSDCDDLSIETETSERRYADFLSEVVGLMENARRQAARAVNSVMTATYFEIGRRIVVYEQGGVERAQYGAKLIQRLSEDLQKQFGRGFSKRNLEQMRRFYILYRKAQKSSALSESPERQQFPLPWSHYIKLLTIEDSDARAFYEAEALRHGWSLKQLNRQMSTQFYERTLLSRNKVGMLSSGGLARKGEETTGEEEIKDPYVLEFLNLKDEFSETDLEDALIRHIEHFLLELGGDFTFAGRQKRLRIGSEWYRIDLLFFHRRLRCLFLIDLKLGSLTPGDVGQMQFYLNYAREHWVLQGENQPIGLILCTEKDEAVVRYAIEGSPTMILSAEYKMQLPDEQLLKQELKRTRRFLETVKNSALGSDFEEN